MRSGSIARHARHARETRAHRQGVQEIPGFGTEGR